MILFIPGTIFSRVRPDTVFMRRMFTYINTIPTNIENTKTNVYVKYRIHTDKRNFTLLCVPTMYAIAKGRRDYIGESYSTLKFHDINTYDEIRHINISTIPHYRKTFPTIIEYFTPNIYASTLFKGRMLSPFNSDNRKYYHYQIAFLLNGKVKVSYSPKLNNTQLVKGWALADYNSGRIISAEIEGEYDMIRVNIDISMGNDESHSIIPLSCDLRVRFKFMGNKIHAWFSSRTMQPLDLPDTMIDVHNRDKIALLRPIPLTNEEADIYQKEDSLNAIPDTTSIQRANNRFRKVMWDVIGDNMVNRLKTKFGSNEQGSIRTSPILNPLYLSYSHRRGVIYRFDIRGQYNFTPNRNINCRIKTGYSFKQHQFYYEAPLNFDYNMRRHGTLSFTIGSGNRITNSLILEQLKHETADSVDFSKMNLDYFKDMHWKLNNNYDISDYLSITTGIIYHKRTAVDKKGFNLVGKPTEYKSFAPNIELTYRPWKWDGPVLSLDYEHGLKGIMGSSIDYEKIEIDGAYKRSLKRLCALSMRLGGGFYTHRSSNTYFLDYNNFQENNLPGGWNDDWTGDFQLLDRNWYNASKYYIRSNLTYEQPMLAISWIPILGHYIETERLYINMLWVDRLHPYMEYGYGFTNRLFSIGIFTSTMNMKFKEFGCRFTFEIFSNW